MIFDNVHLFWLLLLIPVFFGLFGFVRYNRRKQLSKLGNTDIVNKLMLETSNFKPWLKFSILMLAMALLIIALARPEFATETKVNANDNSEIIIALDISNSMLADADNMSFSRLKLAKNAISNMIDNLKNEKIGLVVFAGQAVMQIPITRDYGAFKLILNSLEPDYISAQGTDISDAIDLATSSFSPGKDFHKSIIIISDGEDHEGNIEPAIQRAKKDGITIYTIGIGSTRGNPININGKPMTDKNGQIIISKLNEEILRKISKETNGIYINFSGNPRALKDVYEKMTKSDTKGTTKVVKYDEKYHYFVFPALILLIIEFFILNRRNKWIAKINIFEKKEEQ